LLPITSMTAAKQFKKVISILRGTVQLFTMTETLDYIVPGVDSAAGVEKNSRTLVVTFLCSRMQRRTTSLSQQRNHHYLVAWPSGSAVCRM